MRDTTSGSQGFRCVTLVLGLILAFSATGCNGGPTAPSSWPSKEERVALYTGRWSGNINGFEVVLIVQATAHEFLALEGSGTARNTATGETRQLGFFGVGNWGRDYELAPAVLNIGTPRQISPNGVLLDSGQVAGQFHGDISSDGRVWPGRFTSATNQFDLPFFGPGVHSVTLVKE